MKFVLQSWISLTLSLCPRDSIRLLLSWSQKGQDFCPISCLNTLYKVISRILADRSKDILPDLVLPNQTGFIKNRLLLENVLLASEVLNGYHKKNRSPRITLKFDISKAFDSVRWEFLLQTLRVMQFPSDFLDCIRACITTPSFSLSINGVTSGNLKVKWVWGKEILLLRFCSL